MTEKDWLDVVKWMTGTVAFVIIVLVIGAMAFSAERPVVNVPIEWRKGNWLSSCGSGSCVHASFVTLLRWQGRYGTADMWEKSFSGGEWHTSFKRKLEKQGIRFAYTAGKNDVGFLEWACKTRRGAGVTVQGGSHMVTLVHLDAEWAVTLDSNATRNFIWIPRDKFLANWKASYSWAVAPVYMPSAPAP